MRVKIDYSASKIIAKTRLSSKLYMINLTGGGAVALVHPVDPRLNNRKSYNRK